MTDLTYADQLAQRAAEQSYRSLICELTAVANAQNTLGQYVNLTDCDQDHEVALRFAVEGSVDYWQTAYESAVFQAAAAAKDDGLDINKLVGRSIF